MSDARHGDADDPDGPAVVPGAVDARFTLAAERTMLAWLRTSMGLIAAGVAVLHIFDPFDNPHARTTIGSALVLMGALAAVTGLVRWRRVDRALEAGGPLPGPWPILVLTILIVAVALGFIVWQ
ncbi:hypothetical protein GOARA_064_01960 [Gordonia araii NBRC 100433]|uniref:DUF202 domain-containing protein n=1 Tax=Gordonia araii NBRC 100433 TaxID=1073574 RepID=G7H5R9_9ACTN|nr:DUF202 domain-containing protein [Gordonia araii]NNG95904.1 DUF202 domain-containing protein [Gordonia araii NBRC 100433]GAB11194.1 hypothetical protein GOARA_064_01960 [Gordonia araii NBRC 100433]